MNDVSGQLIDSHGRVLRDLRVSVTDRCNFRCLYCLPDTDAAANFYQTRLGRSPQPARLNRPWQPHDNLLTFEEIERVVRLATSLGIDKIRLTGGEPLLRRDFDKLVARVAAIPGVRDLAMTSNGFLFAARAQTLRQAGLRRVTFSLDSLDRKNFQRVTGRDGLLQAVESIDAARHAGFHPIKVNAVIIRGINDHEIEALAAFARDRSLALRFIEFMPLDSGRGWDRQMVVSAAEILDRLKDFIDSPLPSMNPSETARRWALRDGRGEIGLISPVTEPFCGHCNRLRLTADGKIRTCLFSLHEHDLRSLLRAGAPDTEVVAFLRAVVWQKEARHHIGEAHFVQPQRTMSCIGG